MAIRRKVCYNRKSEFLLWGELTVNIRAVAFDMDDTLLRNDRTVSDYTVRVLRECAALGVRIIPSSGRARKSMEAYVDQIGCATCYIAYNGGELWYPDHTPVFREELDCETIRELYQLAEETGTYCHVYDGNTFLYNHYEPYADAYGKATALQGVLYGSMAAYDKPSAKMLMLAEPEKVMRLIPFVQERMNGKVNASCSKPTYLEITPPRAKKGTALKRAGELFGFTMDETVAFGDSLNDMNMLETAGLAVAVNNARPEVKALVPTVCLSNEEDGVAHFLQEHILDCRDR